MQGVAHHHLLEEGSELVVTAGSVEEDAAVADFPHGPVPGGGGEEGEGEVGGEGDGAGRRRGGVRRHGGVEEVPT